jgi:hypothetical protein
MYTTVWRRKLDTNDDQDVVIIENKTNNDKDGPWYGVFWITGQIIDG